MADWLSVVPSWLEVGVLGRLLLALTLGAAVGIEREMRGKPAGLRTVILITVGAELFTEASIAAASLALHDLVRADPARIAAQVVSGVGFLGAGTILVHRGNVVGLTTAASLWVAAAIGLTVGLRSYGVAVGGTVLVMLTLTVLGWIEARFFNHGTLTIRVRLSNEAEGHAWLRERLEGFGFDTHTLELESTESGLDVTYRVRGRERDQRALAEHLFEDRRVRGVSVE